MSKTIDKVGDKLSNWYNNELNIVGKILLFVPIICVLIVLGFIYVFLTNKENK